MASILLADDHQLVRDTVAAYLAGSGGFDVHTAGDLEDALGILDRPTRIDLAILDYYMPGMDGLEGFARLRARHPELKTAIISGLAKPAVAKEAIELGALGYFPKSIPVSCMLEGIQRVLSGQRVEDLLSVDHEVEQPSTGRDRFGLTAREGEILGMLAVGWSNKMIAGELALKEVTVKFHVSNIMTKLRVTNRTQAALVAREELLV